MDTRIGLLISFDFTMDSMLFTEAENYNWLFKDAKEVTIFIIHQKFENITKYFKFPFKIVKIEKFCDFESYIEKIDVLFTWIWQQQFTDGLISRTYVENYKILSNFTNAGKYVCLRLCDTRHFLRDYKHMIHDKLNVDKFIEDNGSQIFSLENCKDIDYTKFLFICNGIRSLVDWAPATVKFSIPKFKTHEVNCVYLADNILFRYDDLYNTFSFSSEKKKTIYHVGNLNISKTMLLNEISKFTDIEMIFRLGNKPELIKSISSNAEIRIPAIKGMSMYEEMSESSAYLFIGNGDGDTSYYNKTLYDASIARVPFLIFKPVDSNGAFAKISQYYFHDKDTLHNVFDMVCTNPEKHLKVQRDFLLSNQSTETIPWELFKLT